MDKLKPSCLICLNLLGKGPIGGQTNMNKRFLLTQILTLSATCLLGFGACAEGATTASPAPSKTYQVEEQGALSSKSHMNREEEDVDLKRLSESFGNFIGRNLKAPGVSFDIEAVIKGIRDGAAGKPAPMGDQEYEKAMNALQEKAYATLAKENMEAANAFMRKNALEGDVKEIESGKLQYKILSEGQGEEVQPHSTPMIYYTGKYLDGTVFGSSDEVGGPITIPLDQTIPGFSKGLVGMKEGEKRRLFVHPDRGYGMMGNLPPNSLLIFDIEIVKANASGQETGDLDSEKLNEQENHSTVHPKKKSSNQNRHEDEENDDDYEEDDND
jgi:peptidylprolyl isomerase